MSKIITCISGPRLLKSKTQIEGKPIGELRLDLVNLSLEEIQMLWKHAEEWVLTLREPFLKEPNWEQTLKACLKLKPSYVDIDSELDEKVRTATISWVKESESDLILSYHNFEETPEFEELDATVNKLFAEGADVVKVATMAKEEEDNLTIMDLYKEHKRLVAFCMGELGRESRVSALFFGEKLTYAAPTEEELVAPGQFTYQQLYDLLNEGFHE